jgi:hypothetical protein
MKNCHPFLFLFIIAFLHFSCKKPDITPAYLLLSEKDFQDCINMDNFNKEYKTDYDVNELKIISQQLFQDVHVSLNGQPLGFWRLPCTIPLLPNYSGENNIRFIPCVRSPGAVVTTMQYNFLEPITQFFNMEREGEYRLNDFKFEYRKEISFPVLETFMQSTRFSRLDTVRSADINTNQKEDGRQVGKIELNDSLEYFNLVTDYFPLRGQGVQHFWEISYKCDGEIPTYLNFRGAPSGVTIQNMAILPSTRGVWRKSYIDITEYVSRAAGNKSQIETRLGISGMRDSEFTTANFYLEYVKLIARIAPN